MKRPAACGAVAAAVISLWMVWAYGQEAPPTRVEKPAAGGPPADVVQIFDDFENSEPGKAPQNGWVMRFNAQDDPEHNKLVDTVAFSGKKSIQLYGAHGGRWAAQAGLALPPWKEPYLVSCRVRPGDESGKGWNIEAIVGLVYRYQGVNAWQAGTVAFLTDKTVSPRWLSPIVFSRTETYTSNAWYAVQIGVIPEYHRLFFSLNGRYIGCRDVPEKEWPEERFHLDLSSGDGIAWFDDVWARVVPQAGPYVEPLAFLTDEIARALAHRPLVPDVAVSLDITPPTVVALFADRDEPMPGSLRNQRDRLRAEKKWIGAFGTVQLKVRDPQGRSLSAEAGNIPRGVYLCEDLNGDGKKEVTVLLDARGLAPGKYVIEAVNDDAQNPAKCSVFYYDPAAEKLTPLAINDDLEAAGSREYTVNIERTGTQE
ncbi:MAG TPA: hypothetical protein VMZ92_13095 [Planctomycetota bacterium]|nr:hypothetical protein [Planctomycetota bacterium]